MGPVPLLTALPLLAALQGPAPAPPAVGAPLPRWTPGTIEIHQIATGRGNSALLVLPDGTTLLVDAGAMPDGIPETDPHPDGSRSPGAWIARYVRRHLPDSGAGLDYALITHFHPDHYGWVTPESPFDATHSYRLTGITEVGDAIPIHVMIDRGWPDYDYPGPLTDSTIANYRRFLELQRRHGMIVQRFRPGARDQLRLVHDPGHFPGFEIRNIVGNGELWTGSGDSTRQLFPPLATLADADRPNENMCSLGIRLAYGPFRYYTGGDIPGEVDPGDPAWQTMEPAIAPSIGPVAVHVVNQHGSMGEETDAYLGTLASSVLIIPSYAPSHPAPDVLKRIVNDRYPPAQRWVYVTDLRPSTRTVIGGRVRALAGPPGHIVVRVDPGGERYWVMVVSNRDEGDTVLAVRGPLTPR